MGVTIQSHSKPRLARRTRPSKAELIARVEELCAGTPAESPQFCTALLYLASQWTANIDRLAAFAVCDREFVAIRARRWADHGLWGTGETEEAPDPEAFLYAVRVGEGQTRHPLSNHTMEETVDPWQAPSPAQKAWFPAPTPPAFRERTKDDPPMLAEANRESDLEDDPDAMLARLWDRLGIATSVPLVKRAA